MSSSRSGPCKSVKERADEISFQAMLSGDLERQMGIADDPVACRKYQADMAAGDVEKYAPMSGEYGSLEETLNSPIVPNEQCRFCDIRGSDLISRSGKKLLRCSACKLVNYCGQQCQKLDWKYHKEDCAFLRSDPKGFEAM